MAKRIVLSVVVYLFLIAFIYAGIKVISISGPTYKDRGEPGFEYFGMVKNVGDKTARYVKIYIYLYSSSGNLLDYEWVVTEREPLPPGEQSPWRSLFPDDDRQIRRRLDKSKTRIEIEVAK